LLYRPGLNQPEPARLLFCRKNPKLPSGRVAGPPRPPRGQQAVGSGPPAVKSRVALIQPEPPPPGSAPRAFRRASPVATSVFFCCLLPTGFAAICGHTQLSAKMRIAGIMSIILRPAGYKPAFVGLIISEEAMPQTIWRSGTYLI
jgi:hypothetical protein